MRQVIQLRAADVMPELRVVCAHQGIPNSAPISDKIQRLIDQATEIFVAEARPVGLIADISALDFATVYHGQGDNDEEAPLRHIFPAADRLTLFALTMGGGISAKIEAQFSANDFAIGSALDSVASMAAEKAVAYFETMLATSGRVVLSYSPGYCGWHISGQKKLFQYLDPDEIDITLNDSFLMTPLKSVSGILIDGKAEIHRFDNNFKFCRLCKTRSCLPRMKRI